MRLSEVVATSRTVAGTRSRLAKRAALADLLHDTGPGDVPVVVAFLSGELRQRRTGLGWASLRSLPPPAEGPTLEVAEVDDTFAAMAELSGPGSATVRNDLAAGLFGRATRDEQDFLRGLVSGSLRQGALDSVMVDAVAQAADLPADQVRRAVMLSGATGPVAAAALASGTAGLAAFGLVVGRPVRPMLASSAPDVGAALDKVAGSTIIDAKLDGIRIQVHKDGDDVEVFTRSLDRITPRVPEIAEVVGALPARHAVLDGEALVLDEAGTPRPFQETASRSSTQDVIEQARLTPYFFDVLHLDGDDLIDRPLRERLAVLDRLVPPTHRVSRASGDDPEAAQAFFDEVVAAGQEGIVVKAADSPYEAGRRGAGWVKVKPRHTLDLVVLAVEWGSGRRTGTLSNIHLGARDPEGGFVMLGKTFKGMTDEILAWQTERFTELATSPTDRSEYVVHVRPEQVVEIAFDGVQRSTRYPGGVALRFARVLRYREDKTAAEADMIGSVRALL